MNLIIHFFSLVKQEELKLFQQKIKILVFVQKTVYHQYLDII